MIEIKSMALHNTFFISGCNLGLRLDGTAKAGLRMFYDTENKRYIVTYKGTGKFVHESNVADSEPKDTKDLGLPKTVELALTTPPPPLVNTAGPAPINRRAGRKAQVSDPARGIK